MKTESLRNSIRILDFRSNLDEEYRQSLIEELSRPDQDIMTNFIEPFSTELNRNLLHKESQDGLKIVIRHYIDTFLIVVPHITSTKNIILEKNEILNDISEYGVPLVLESSDLSDYYKYVILSYYIFDYHFYDIQTCCLKYNLDFFKFCREIHFSIELIDIAVTQHYMDTEVLIHSKNDLEKKVENKKIKPFPEYLLHEKRNELAEICKNVFNKGQSPKEYAIMFCLLSDKGFVTVPKNRRKNHYMAWYIFINKPFPKNNNFYSINKFIFEKGINGLFFKDECDPDLLQLESTFDKIIKTNKLL